MKLLIVAHSIISGVPPEAAGSPLEQDIETGSASYLDLTAEMAGRACYKSWGRPNPGTATNRAYLENILKQGHYSVLEHAVVTFWVEGVSRSLLLELERHRFLSFSVESQRYVDTEKYHQAPAVPPAFREESAMPLESSALRLQLENHYQASLVLYRSAYNRLTDLGYPAKQAREAARSYLPNATPVDFLVTGNLRTWRDVLGKRLTPAADAEMQEFAELVYRRLKVLAPNAMQFME